MSVDDFNSNILTPLIDKVSSENKTLVLMGDFNIDFLKADSNCSATNVLDITSSFSLLPHIILPD